MKIGLNRRWVLCAIVAGVAVGGECHVARGEESSRVAAGDSQHGAAAAPIELEFVDIDGRVHRANDWTSGHGVAILFIGTECPVSNLYTSVNEALFKEYAARGVAFIGVHCDRTVSADEARAHAKEYGLTFPIALDHDQTLARVLAVKTVPTAVLLSNDGVVMYRGRIDDRFSLGGKRRDEPKTRDFALALEAVANGDVPDVRETSPYGCPLPPR